PERMGAHPGAAAGTANSAPAEVVTKMYLGDQVQIVARLASGSEVIVREQRTSADPALDTVNPGDKVAITWDEAATPPTQIRRRRSDRRAPRHAQHPGAGEREAQARLPASPALSRCGRAVGP